MGTTLKASSDLTNNSSKVSVFVENSGVVASLVHRQLVKDKVLKQAHLNHLNLLQVLRLLDLVICTHPPYVQNVVNGV